MLFFGFGTQRRFDVIKFALHILHLFAGGIYLALGIMNAVKHSPITEQSVKKVVRKPQKPSTCACTSAVMAILGGGMLVELSKHAALDEAQEQITILQNQLQNYRTELANIAHVPQLSTLSSDSSIDYPPAPKAFQIAFHPMPSPPPQTVPSPQPNLGLFLSSTLTYHCNLAIKLCPPFCGIYNFY